MNNDALRVKDAVDIVSYAQARVPSLKKVGRLFKACCPVHSEKTPSFVVSLDTQQWRCYGACATGGDVISLVMWLDHATFGEALQTLADYAHISLTPLTHTQINAQAIDGRQAGLLRCASDIFHAHLYTPAAHGAYTYLRDVRGLTDETLKAFQIGYAPQDWQWLHDPLKALGYSDDELLDTGLCKQGEKTGKLYDAFRGRLIFPICDARGQVRGFGARTMTDESPKYLNSPQSDAFNKSTLLYAFHRAKSAIRETGRVIVCEGYMDVLQAHNHGFTNVVGQMGTAFTKAQIETLSQVPMILFALDADRAGQAATQRIAEDHIKSGLDLRLLVIEHGKDPDDMIKANPDAWAHAANTARPLVDVLIERAAEGLSQNATVLEKQGLERRLSPLVTVSGNAAYTLENHHKLARILGLPESVPRPVLTIVPPTPKATPMPSALEMAVLYSILVNDDQWWLERAAVLLAKSCPDELPYALGPLVPLDFPHPLAQRLMGLILTATRTGVRPVYDFVETQAKDTDVEALYERLFNLPSIEAVFEADVKRVPRNDRYETFIDQVFRLRTLRLQEDMKTLSSLGDDDSIARWDECARAKSYLCRLSSAAGR